MGLNHLVLSSFWIQNYNLRLSTFWGKCLKVDHFIVWADIWNVITLVCPLSTSGDRWYSIIILLAALKLRIDGAHATEVILLLLQCRKGRGRFVCYVIEHATLFLFLLEHLTPKTWSLLINQRSTRRSCVPSESTASSGDLFLLYSLWSGRITLCFVAHNCKFVSYSSIMHCTI